ncbi:MAG: DUF3800 domain-containing protein [Tissierella sp.]|nr:DUF3800 domain-containing protein [Tissierella sp.]
MGLYNIYCDESCHLENDGINVMVLGAVWCRQDKIKSINDRIKQIKLRNGINPEVELKWTKVSPAKLQLYEDIIDYFFDDDDLNFRCLVVPDKSILDHARYNQTHNDWYYKMYFTTLKTIFSPFNKYEVYIDIKDTNSSSRARKLHEVCCNDIYDFSNSIIKRVQPIRSNEVQIMQIVDLLIGAMGYVNRRFPDDFVKSNAKIRLIDKIKLRSGYQLTKTTLLRENKFNILIWDVEN